MTASKMHPTRIDFMAAMLSCVREQVQPSGPHASTDTPRSKLSLAIPDFLHPPNSATSAVFDFISTFNIQSDPPFMRPKIRMEAAESLFMRLWQKRPVDAVCTTIVAPPCGRAAL